MTHYNLVHIGYGIICVMFLAGASRGLFRPGDHHRRAATVRACHRPGRGHLRFHITGE